MGAIGKNSFLNPTSYPGPLPYDAKGSVLGKRLTCKLHQLRRARSFKIDVTIDADFCRNPLCG